MSSPDIGERQKLAHAMKKRIIADLEQFEKVYLPPEIPTDPKTRQFVTDKLNGLAEQLHKSFETVLKQTID